VLAHHTQSSGNFITLTSFLLKQIPSENVQTSYSYEGYMFHYLVEGGLTCLCLTEEMFDAKVAFAFLFDTKSRFDARYSTQEATTASAFQMNSTFARILANQMDYYSHNPSADKINQAKVQLSNTKKLMTDNVGKLMARGEHVELLVGTASTTEGQAAQFQAQSKTLHKSFWWKNAKLTILLIFLVLVILYLTLSLFR